MKQRAYVISLMLITFGIAKIYAQTDWVLDSSNNYISTSVIDSITFTKDGDSYIQNLWYKGNVIEKGEIEEGDCYLPKEVPLEYEYCTFEEDGMDGIVTETGLYAILQHTPDSTGYILSCGLLDDDLYSCLRFDSLGYATDYLTFDNKTYHLIYSPNELWLVDSEGNIIAEIPYTVFNEEEIAEAKCRAPRRESYTRNILYNGISIFNQIAGYRNNPRQSLGLDVLHYLLNGYGKRYGDLLGKLIKAGFDPLNPLSWLDVLDTANDISFFGNASITALDAIKQDVCSFITPCKVEGLTYNTDVFRNMRARYEELMDYSYTLKMSVQTSSFPHKEKQSKQIKIDRDGTYNDFYFDFKELQTLYDYEPSLTLDITVKKFVSEQQLKELRNAVLAINPDATFDNITEPIWYTIKKSCTISGTPNSLVTGSVSSKVEKINNVKTTTADIICSFSSVPSGANCVVNIARAGSDIGLTFNGTPGKSSQTIKATGLSVNTTYVATTYITYNGRKYDGVNSVSFTTNGPSGSVLSVDNVTEKTAVAKCQFNGVESGVECGVIAKSSSQTLTFPASAKEGEQSVTMSGLTPATTYQCYAYVRTSNHYQEQENGVSFTTKEQIPDVVGTWQGTQYLLNGNVYETFTLTLNADGTAEINETGENIMNSGIAHGSWTVSSNGSLGVNIVYYSTDTQWSTKSLSGTLDNVESPSRVEGSVYWYRGHVMGGYADYTNTFVMTR